MIPDKPFLSQEQVESFHARGYLAVDAVCPPEELASVKETLIGLFEKKTGWEQGAQFDMMSLDDGIAPLISPQIIDPAVYAPALKETRFHRNAMAIARQLLGQLVKGSYEHAIYKPPYRGSATPWHQDEAFHQAGMPSFDTISIWMPLQDVTEQNGCLKFIPASHLGEVLRHRSPNDDPRVHGLECIGGFNEATAVACPLLAGGATIHHGRTLHAAGPNRSALERCAWVLTFKAPRANAGPTPAYPWNVGKRTARMARREAWRSRGGILGRVRRKLKSAWGAKP